jgi:peptidylprolyl isomerase
MRRIVALFIVPLIAGLALAGCGSSSTPASTNATVTANGSFGKAPTVTIPKEKPGSTLAVKTLIRGNGATISKTDSFVSNFALYLWSGTSHKLLDSTYTTSPQALPATLLPGIQSAIVGQKVGSRVLAVIPPKEGYGTSGNSQLGVKGTDTLVFVMDVIQKFSNTASASGTQVSNGGGSLPTVTAAKTGAPTVKVPTTVTPPKTLTVKTLIKGSGAAVAKGQAVVAQYTGSIWRTGAVFDSSWSRGTPFSFQIGATPSQVIPGWDKGLVGQTVGSRVMLIIPPADGYGSAGQSQAGIKGTDTLVFVVDILGAVSPSSAG